MSTATEAATGQQVRHYMRDSIEAHRLGYGYTTVAAINVKHYGRWPFERVSTGDYAGKTSSDLIDEIARIMGQDADQVSQMIFEIVQESFWEQAQELAREAGYDRCFSEGRSGGWLYVQPHIEVDRDRFGDYTIADFGERSRWLAFQRKIRHMVEGIDSDLRCETEFRRNEAQDFDGC